MPHLLEQILSYNSIKYVGKQLIYEYNIMKGGFHIVRCEETVVKYCNGSFVSIVVALTLTLNMEHLYNKQNCKKKEEVHVHNKS